jgi:hypothetical protein
MSTVVRLSDIYCAKQRERTTALLRTEVAEKTFTMTWLCEFVAALSALEPVNDAVFVGWD